jgi:hypothetical protein
MCYYDVVNRIKLEAKGYRTALWVGCALFGLGLLLQWTSLPESGAERMLASRRLLGTICVSVATVIGTLGTGILFRDFWMDRVKKRSDKRFREFFGESAVNDSVRLVHAERRLKEEDEDKMGFVSPTANCSKKTWVTQQKSFVPEGITRWLCAEDNYAATAITALFSQRTVRFPRQVYDSFIEDDAMNFCTVGLGLGFNEFTHFVCAMTRGRMFRVTFKQSVKLGVGSGITDEFVVPFFGNDPEETVEWHFPVPSQDTDVALILRVPTQPSPDGDFTTQFVVAGRTAAGTAIAGAYLATRWEDLHRLYREDHVDMATNALLVILEHKRSPQISASDPSKAILSSGARCYLGKFEKLKDTDVSSTDLNSFKSLNFDDVNVVREFAASIRKRGYGFYNPNVLTRSRDTNPAA